MDTLHSILGLSQEVPFLFIILEIVKRLIALIGVAVILWGAGNAFFHIFSHRNKTGEKLDRIDLIRLDFGRMIILGLEFIVAADVIATTTAPDYHSLGILASLVGIRTFLTFFMNRELRLLGKKNHPNN